MESGRSDDLLSRVIDDDKGAADSAFTTEEIAAVADWVKGGGALLLIAAV